MGQVIHQISPNGQSLYHEYDQAYRLWQSAELEAYPATLASRPNPDTGRIVSFFDNAGNTTSRQWQRVRSVVNRDPETGQVIGNTLNTTVVREQLTDYDHDGQVMAQRGAAGQNLTLQRNADGLVAQRRIASELGTLTETLAYDPLRRLESITDAKGITRMAYDG